MQGPDISNINVSQLLETAQYVATLKHNREHLMWIKLSHSLGSLIADGATLTIQSLGKMDLLLRVLEDERVAKRNMVEGSSPAAPDFSLDIQNTLSEYWVGSAYEIFRSAKEKNTSDEAARQLHDDLRLVRVPLEKYQLPQDHKLTEPLPMGVIGDDGSDIQMYDKTDKNRSHIIGRAISGRGSIEWMAIDVVKMKNIRMERRYLSERILAYGDKIDSA